MVPRLAAFLAGAVAFGLDPAAAQVKPESRSVAMDFDQCLATIRATAGQVGVAPVNIVETGDVRIVRFPSKPQSVLIACSKPDRKMVITVSPHQ